MLQLERFSYYQHLSLTGGQERPIYSCRIVDIRGTRFHVLSRIQDSGLDFTGRTNFIAHHLVFTPEEIRQIPTPPVILREWPGWVKSWTKEPQMLENEDLAEFTALAGRSNVPAQTWQRVADDAVNGYGLLEARVGASFCVDNQADETVLDLIAESLELLEVRDTRRDFRTAAWNYTFTTSMQEQDNPADFRWRCIHSDNLAASRFATPNCLEIAKVRASPWTDKEKEKEETAFARTGRQQPSFVEQPKNQSVKEGDDATFAAKAVGIPIPKYQWYECDRNENEKNPIVGQTSPILVLKNLKQGTTRYAVWATNGVGNGCRSISVKLEVEPPKKPLTISKQDGISSGLSQAATQKPKVVVWEDSDPNSSDSQESNSFWWLVAIIVSLAIAGGAWWWIKHHPSKQMPGSNNSKDQVAAVSIAASVKPAPMPTGTSAISSDQPPQTQLPNGKAGSSETNSGTAKAVAPRQPLVQDDIAQLPPPWTKKTIGVNDSKSSVVLDGDKYVVTGCGENIYAKSDSFFFVDRSVSNSVEFVVRLSSKKNEVGSRRGIMMRGSENADAPFVFIGLSQQFIFWMQRPAAGINCSFAILPAPQLPVFFKLARQAKTFSGAFSTDGVNWTGMGTNEIVMPDQNYFVGFAVCSGKNNVAVHAEFDKVTITAAKQ